jgi:lipid-A-disaccharide synthase
MKYYIIAGEASGDLHGSNLIKAIRSKDQEAQIRCWGGDKMEEAGATLVKHYRELAFMGFVEVIANLGTILKNLKFCKSDISSFQPDVLVLIDYPGFNLRIAEWAKKHGFKVVYYISPQVWAWKAGRVKKMKLCIDRLITILPFEKNYFEENWNWNVDYAGHPLLEAIHDFQKDEQPNHLSDNPIIALLPGSRKQEIRKKLPVMLEVSRQFSDYQFIVARAPGLDEGFYEPILKGYDNVTSISGKTYSLLSKSTAALVTSGTATLETALLGIPQVVCYKGSEISYQIAKRLVKIKFISLVNLILNKEAVKELIQGEFNTKNVANELSLILPGGLKREKIIQDYAELKRLLQSENTASSKAAGIIVEITENKPNRQQLTDNS